MEDKTGDRLKRLDADLKTVATTARASYARTYLALVAGDLKWSEDSAAREPLRAAFYAGKVSEALYGPEGIGVQLDARAEWDALAARLRTMKNKLGL